MSINMSKGARKLTDEQRKRLILLVRKGRNRNKRETAEMRNLERKATWEVLLFNRHDNTKGDNPDGQESNSE